MKPAQVSKNRSPPPPSRSRSTSIIFEPNATEVTSKDTKAPSNRRSRQRTTNRRVHFSSEVEDEQVMDSKDNDDSDDPLVPESPTRAPPVRIQQTDREFSSRTPGASMGHTNSTAFPPTPTRRLRPNGDAGVIEEITSDEGEDFHSHHPSTAQIRDRFRGDDNIRSGLKSLLDANGQVPAVGANIAVVLETLLSQINKGSNKGLV
jgi:hypothetical protein